MMTYFRKDLVYSEDSLTLSFLKLIFPSLNLNMSTATNRGFHSKIKNRMANSIDSD